MDEIKIEREERVQVGSPLLYDTRKAEVSGYVLIQTVPML